MIRRIREGYQAFPLSFRVLVIAMFIDRLGGTVLFPYFALYVTRKFQVGMTEAGVLLGLFSISGMAGSVVGGALADKIGRRSIVIFGLVTSALGSLLMGFSESLWLFYGLAVVVGFLGSIASPAHQAMVADILPEEQRGEGFGLMRIAANLAWILGPTIGGLLATRSYLLLFGADALGSTITALIVYRLIPETKPAPEGGAPSQSFLQTISGYRAVFRDGLYMGFLVASMLMLLVYQQMYSTLAVYLRDVHGVPDRGYGILLSLDALVVVVLQLWVARRVKVIPPMLAMALGTMFYLVGFSMYGFVDTYPLFVAAIVVITFGEMIVMPVSQALAALFAPEDMRGRYMAFFDFAWTIPSTFGAASAGLILDNYNPNWVWYACGIVASLAVVGFLWLHSATQSRFAGVEASLEQA
jgi:MFS family permease